MRRHLIALLGFLSGAAVYYMKAPVRETASIQDDFHQQEFVSTSQAAPSPLVTAPAKVIPVEVDAFDPSSEESNSLPGLPRGMKFAPKVRAIPEDQYSEGKILLKKNGFIFYRGKAGEGNANVVYDQRLNTFHPLTATIKLTGINEEKRNEILKAWDEYHYNADLGVQYVQSSHETLLDDFEELKKSGAKASLEIIQSVYQSR
ncbi:MAG: hypothetical protein V4598_11570 [Bdellovibrionota bacterium]